MSRGPGRMMRYALDYLRENKKPTTAEYWTSLYVVAWAYERDLLTEQAGREVPAYDVRVTYSGRESMRRAVKSLERDGLVETCQRWYSDDDHHYWGGLHYRLSAQEREKLSVGNSPTLRTPEEAGEMVRQLQDLIGGGS